MDNPFEGLRPEMRSEEDEIRKGIFCRALRNIQEASLERRRVWCHAIRQSTVRRGISKVAPSTVTVLPSASTGGSSTAVFSAAPVQPPSRSDNIKIAGPSASPSASLATYSESSHELSVHLPAVGQKRFHNEDGAALHNSEESGETGRTGTSPFRASQAPKVESDVCAGASSIPSSSKVADTVASAAAPSLAELGESEESVQKCIAAYMCSLLDRVVGTGIDNLAVPALKMLCTLLGIETTVSNKVGLYSILASFYFTQCANLGKRVSRDTLFNRHVAQEVAMLQHVTPTSSHGLRTEKKVLEKVNGEGAKHSPRHAVAREAKTTTKRVGREPLARPLAVNPPSLTKRESRVDPTVEHFLKYEHYEDDGLFGEANRTGVSPSTTEPSPVESAEEVEVVYGQPAFYKPHSRSAITSSHMSKYEASTDSGEGWTQQQLERKVASVVHLYDPVTVATVVKRLSSMGYRENDAESRVEQILRRFHDRQLIFYDCGIAYMM